MEKEKGQIKQGRKLQQIENCKTYKDILGCGYAQPYDKCCVELFFFGSFMTRSQYKGKYLAGHKSDFGGGWEPQF